MLCKAVDGHDVRQGRRATAGERVSWSTSPPEPALIRMLSRGILDSDSDRLELAVAHNCCSPH